MVDTKAEATAKQIEDLTAAINSLKTDLTTKIDGLSATTTSLGERIENVHCDITTQLQNLDVKFEGEVEILRNTALDISSCLNQWQKVTTDRFNTLEANFGPRLNTLEQRGAELNTAIAVVDEQARRIVSLEKSCHRGLQHSRSFDLEIDGIPVNIGDEPEQLEEAALKIFHALNVDVLPYDIDTIHRMKSRSTPKPTIIRFVSRKVVRKVHENKHKLRQLAELELDIAGLTEESKIFIRASQCPYYKNLSYNCRLLKRHGLIARVYTGKDGRISIKKLDGSNINITHKSDLAKNFMGFEEFDFNYDDFNENENE